MFWATAIPEGSIQVNLGKGIASLKIVNIPLSDAFTVANSLNSAHPLGMPVPATIDSLDLEWQGVIRRVEFSDPTNTFAGLFLQNTATIAVTASTPPTGGQDGFAFVSDPTTTTTNYAEVAHEQNGVFFSG